MKFRLTYRGRLQGNGNADHKHDLRRQFHRQLTELWKHPPLSDPHFKLMLTRPTDDAGLGLIERAGGWQFSALVTQQMDMLCELDILFLRASRPGAVVGSGGDLDNRIKTLMDALRVPKVTEIPAGWKPGPEEQPLHCLLQDDRLVDAMSIRTDRLLEDMSGTGHPELEAMLVIAVTIHGGRSLDTMELGN